MTPEEKEEIARLCQGVRQRQQVTEEENRRVAKYLTQLTSQPHYYTRCGSCIKARVEALEKLLTADQSVPSASSSATLPTPSTQDRLVVMVSEKDDEIKLTPLATPQPLPSPTTKKRRTKKKTDTQP